MSQPAPSKPDYANWVSSRPVYLPAAPAVLLGGLLALSPWFVLPALVFLVCAVYFAYARWEFSGRGGGVQAKIQALVLQHLRRHGSGAVLDIGCGNGALTIAIANTNSSAQVTGIDDWGRSWEFSRTACEENASIDGVAERVIFERASAAVLPFDEGTFDVVVSNLVSHEVRGVTDKKLLLKEAVRVSKKGGSSFFRTFSFGRGCTAR